ncbi:GNAT family N-acetyltransferase [Pseudomonas sp. 102515]|uniref:GNAT family N-acetyltransferase n=1 Tax=Pseudomonas sp. 102515 TaxID=3071568 RepID=UPI0028025A1A|nr:GNAT family N-acetyltransferase [Pseudomonas sp. 102515]MDQ7914255.1 GNAT family N-acetyltransferase [Pseudomonas sp. 102515]
MSISYDIRRATPDDIPALIELRAHLLDAGGAPYASRTPTDTERWRRAYPLWLATCLEGSDRVLILCAEHKYTQAILGCATGIIDDRAPAPDCLNGRSGWVQSVAVAPELRRCGIAKALMQRLLDWFRTRQVNSVALQTTPAATSLYQRLGFASTGEALLVRAEGRP